MSSAETAAATRQNAIADMIDSGFIVRLHDERPRIDGGPQRDDRRAGVAAHGIALAAKPTSTACNATM
jgi:hypothetical protein